MPDEWFWFAIMMLDEVVDGRFQFLGRAVDAAPKLAFCEQSVATNPKMPVFRRSLNSVMQSFLFNDHVKHQGSFPSFHRLIS